MKKLASNSKIFLAFASGCLFVGLLKISPLNASTGAPTGSCVAMANYNTWAYPTGATNTRDHAESGIINFDTRTHSAFINQTTSRGNTLPPTYSGEAEDGNFTIETGPINGTYKLLYSENDWVIIAPANNGNTFFMLHPQSGMTGVCQKI